MSKRIKQKAPAVCHELQVSDEDIATIDPGDLVRMLLLMHLIRAFETTVLEFKDLDLVHGPVHASIGQEAVAAAVAVALH